MPRKKVEKIQETEIKEIIKKEPVKRVSKKKILEPSIKSLEIRDNIRPRWGRTNFVQIHFYGYVTPPGSLFYRNIIPNPGEFTYL